jgi:hypothetical protein
VAELPLAFVSLDEDETMSDTHVITPSEIGMIRIYLKPRDKAGRPRAACGPRARSIVSWCGRPRPMAS